MRTLFSMLLLVGIISCSNSKKSTGNAGNLNGTWMPVAEEIGGQVLPAVAFSKQRLTITDSTYTMIAESIDKGVVRTAGDKMDIYGKEGVNKGRHFTALYKLDNNELVICYNLKGDSYPESFDSKGKPLFFLCRFRQETQPGK